MTNEFRGLWTIDCMITKFDSTSNPYRTEYSDVRFGWCVTNTVRVQRCATIREMKEGAFEVAIRC